MWNTTFGVLLSAGVLIGAAACTPKEEPAAEADTATVSGPASALASAPDAAAASPARGEELYKKNCVACHGVSGKGDGPAAGALEPKPRDHTDRAYMSTLSDKEVGDIIRMGGAVVNKPLMPSHPQINGADLTALVGYVRSLSEPAAGS